MSLPSAYTSLLNELNRDILRATPSDPLQFCANWFFQRLEQDRIRNHQSTQSSQSQQHTTPTLPTTTTTTTTAALGYLPSQEVYHTPTISYNAHYNPIPIQLAYSPVINPSYSPVPIPIHSHLTTPQSYLNPFQQSQVQPTHQYITSHHQPITYQAHPTAHLDSNHVAPPAPPPHPHHHHHHHTSPHHSPQPALASGEQRAYSFGRPNSTPTHQHIRPTEHHHPHSPPQPHHHHHHHPAPPPPSSHHHHHHQSPSHHQPHPSSRITVGTSNRDRLSSQPAYGTGPHSEISPRAASATMPHHQRGTDQRVKPPSCSSSDEEASDESDSAEPPMVPSGYNFGRRTSVSAESLSPSNLASGPSLPKVVIPKTTEQRSRIESSIKENLLFRNLDEEQYNDVLNAMSELKVSLGTEVIVQGGVGDFFYVVEEGTFDVYVRGPATYTYVPPIANGATGTLSLPLDHQSQQDPIAQRGQTPVGGTTVTHQAPAKKVHSYGPGGSFGELALMYNAPRAATVVATSESATLWALDRVTFRSILMEHTSRKRKMYESFLSTVPILASLTAGERSKIADSLEERTINEGVEVVREGEIGREFYIIESGRVEVTKKKDGESVVVGSLGKGDHFGELALLNSAPRAATVTVIGGRLRVAALGEKAFTRLLGPVIEILSRHAESHYGQSSIIKRTTNLPPSQSQSNGTSAGNGTFGNWSGMGSATASSSGMVGNSNGRIGPTTSAFAEYRLDQRPKTSSSSSSLGQNE